MTQRTLRLILALAAATATLAVVTTAASATRLEIPNSERGFRIQWPSLTLEAAGVRIVCPITLSGSFALRTFAKRAGTRIGGVTAATAGACTEGTWTFLAETLPWEITYNSFGGSLPTITSLTWNLLRISWQITNGITCLARSEVSRPLRFIYTVSGESITGARADETATITTTGGFFCTLGGAAHFAGTANFIRTSEGGSSIQLRLEGTTTPTPPTLTPSPVAFGTVEPSSTTERTVTIDARTETFTVNSISMRTGTSYSIADPNGCRGMRMTAGQRCSFTVTFRAPAEYSTEARDTLNVETTVRLLTDEVSGSTPTPPRAEPSPVEFGRLATSTLDRRAVTVSSGAEARIETIRVRTGAYFAITDPNGCVGSRLSAGGRCTFNVIVETPSEAGTTLEDSVVITTNINTINDALRATT